MVTLEQAIEIAETEATGFKVKAAFDCGDRWAFYFAGFEGTFESLDAFVFKDSGYCDFFFRTEENLNILKHGKKVQLKD